MRSWTSQRGRSLRWGQRTEGCVVEQALGIGPRLGEDPRKVRQACTDDVERFVLLPGFVARLADGREFVDLQVLHLVDEQGNTAIEFDRGIAQVQCKIGEIRLQRAGVGATVGGLQLDAHRQRSIRRSVERE